MIDEKLKNRFQYLQLKWIFRGLTKQEFKEFIDIGNKIKSYM